MAWIAKTDGVDGRFTYAANLAQSTNGSFEIKFRVLSIAGTYVHIATLYDSLGINRIVVENSGDKVQLNQGGGTDAAWSGVFGSALSVGQDITLRFETAGGSLKRLYVNGVDKGTASTNASYIGYYRHLGVSDGVYSEIGIYYATFIDNNNSANNVDLQADSSSHGTGTAVLTDVNGHINASAVNLPTDGSVWEDLGSGGISYSNSLASGAVSLTGSSISASRWYYASLSGGGFSLTGSQLQQLIQIARDVSSGNVTALGQSISGHIQIERTISVGDVTISGQTASSYLQFERVPQQGVVSITGNQILSAASYSSDIQSGTIAVNGQAVSTFKGIYSDVQSGVASINGTSVPVTVNYSRALQSGVLIASVYSVTSGAIFNA